MKKEKTSSKQSEKERHFPNTKVLVPLLSKREAEPAFIEKVASKAKEITLLLVIDTNAMAGEFGFATNEIASGNALMQQVKTALGKKRKTCNDIIEWGDTATKIEHLAELHKVDKIYLVEQDNQFFQDLLKDMEEKLKKTQIERIVLPKFE